MFKIVFKSYSEIVFVFNKYIVANKMSFLKCSDPEKRDFIVEEFLKTKQNVKKSCPSVWVNLAHNTNFKTLQTNYRNAKMVKKKHR